MMPAGAGVVLAGSAIMQYMASRNAANASRDAARTQSDSANQAITANSQAQQQALDFYERMWNQNQQNMAPYVQMGHNALGSLANLTGLPGLNGIADPRGGQKLGNGGRTGTGTVGMSTLGGMSGPPGSYTAPQMVTMIAPNGEQQQVPAAMASHYAARGARRVS